MKKLAKEIKKGDKITLAGIKYLVKEAETSDIGKQGARKCRFVLESNGKQEVIIRPDNYPIESE